MASPPFTIVGTPFSTFTRTVTLGLTHKGLAFNQVRVLPHSDTAYEHHPFGYLPTLVIHDIDGQKADLNLRESQAIVRYIERVAPTPPLVLADGGDGHTRIPEQMWEFASLAGAFGFPAVEHGVVKPRVAATDEGVLADNEIRSRLATGIRQLGVFFERMEALMAPEGYVFGDKLTWADFFLFPLLADLKATPEGELLTPRLVAWMDLMERLEAVQKTKEGTLSDGARPP